MKTYQLQNLPFWEKGMKPLHKKMLAVRCQWIKSRWVRGVSSPKYTVYKEETRIFRLMYRHMVCCFQYWMDGWVVGGMYVCVLY